MTLQEICELLTREEVESWFLNYNLNDYLTDEQISLITSAGVWNKEKLARKIVDHYYVPEIGFETIGLFKHYAKVYMQEIMERKLPIIYSQYLKYDPLSNVDFTETYTREIVGNTNMQSNGRASSNSNSNSSGSGLQVNSDTPQGEISKQNILNGTYATSTSANESSNNSLINDITQNQGTSNGSSNQKEIFTRHEEGDNGVIITNQRLVKEYREIISAVDEDIIKELNKLFMGLY